MHIVIAAATALVSVVAPVGGDPVLPNLRGTALEDGSGLTLLGVGELIDVDTVSRRTIEGLGNVDAVGWWSFQHGHHVVIELDCHDCEIRPEVFVYDLDEEAPARRITTQRFVTPGANETLLAKEYLSDGRCQLERIDLDGSIIDPARPIDCDIQPFGETDVGIIAHDYVSTVSNDYVVVNPVTLDEKWRWSSPLQLHAIVGDRALLSDRRVFLIINLATNEEFRIDAPEALGSPGEGLVSRDGRYVAIEYRSPQQIMDLWVLDLGQLVWVRAPSMPVRALIKRAPPAWTADGRLAVVGDFGADTYRRLLAVWRPGDADWAIRDVDPEAHFVLDHHGLSD